MMTVLFEEGAAVGNDGAECDGEAVNIDSRYGIYRNSLRVNLIIILLSTVSKLKEKGKEKSRRWRRGLCW